MPVSALPIITEGKELHSANRNNENKLTLNMKINNYNTPLNGLLLTENEYLHDVTSFNKLNGHEAIISNKLEGAVSYDSRKPEEVDLRKPEETDKHKPEETDKHKPEEADLRKREDSDSHMPEEVDSRKLEEADSCKPENSVSSESEEADSRKHEEENSHKSEEADSQKSEEANSHKSDKADAHKPEEANSRKPEEANSSKPEEADSHKSEEANSPKSEEADLRNLDSSVSHKPEKTASSKPDSFVLRKRKEGVSHAAEKTDCCKLEELIPRMPKITVSCSEEDNVSLKLDDAESFKLLKTVNNESIDTVVNDENNNDNNISKPRRLKSKNSQPWVTRLTKKELDALLPSRSHFSCHDKALREAGYIPEEVEKRKTERKERRKIFREKLFKARCGQHILENNMANDPTSIHKEPSDTLLDSDLSDKSTQRYRKKLDELPKVEHKALTEYLRYVKENPNEYLEHLSRRQTSGDNWAVRNLIKTAMVFQRGHHGIPYTTPAVRASHSISPRFADPGLWLQLNKDFASKRLVRMDSSISKLAAEKEKETKVESDEPKTDYEKALSRAERWAKTVSTAQFLRARLEALREVEEEDTDVTKWWINMKKCNYIRTHSAT